MKKNRLFLPILVFLLATTVTGCGVIGEHEKFHETYDVEQGATLKVLNSNGKIVIESWSEDHVEVNAVKFIPLFSNDDAEIKVSTGAEMVIKTEHSQSSSRVSVEYEIYVPEGLRIEEVKSFNGLIELSGISGDTLVETSNGNITINGAEGSISAKTSNGNIVVRDVAAVTALKSSNGKISAELAEMSESVEIATSNGSIDLFINPLLDLTIEASTFNGGINLHELGITVQKMESKLLYGDLGKGGNLLSVRTSNGSINLYPLRSAN